MKKLYLIKSIIFVGLIFFVCFRKTNAQEVVLNKSILDSLLLIGNCENEIQRRISYNLCNIYKFNQIKTSIGEIDTINTFKEGTTYYAKYKGHKINLESTTINEKGVIILWGMKVCRWGFLFSKIFYNDSTSTEIIVTNSEPFKEDPLIKIKNYFKDVICGQYREQTLSGEFITLGNYALIDSIYQDTIITYNPETYEEIVKIYKRESTGVKCGKWIKRDFNGKIIEKSYEKKCK